VEVRPPQLQTQGAGIPSWQRLAGKYVYLSLWCLCSSWERTPDVLEAQAGRLLQGADGSATACSGACSSHRWGALAAVFISCISIAQSADWSSCADELDTLVRSSPRAIRYASCYRITSP
jgi:hypothetical protein